MTVMKLNKYFELIKESLHLFGTRVHVEKSQHVGVRVGLSYSSIEVDSLEVWLTNNSTWSPVDLGLIDLTQNSKFYIKNNILNVHPILFIYIFIKSGIL